MNYTTLRLLNKKFYFKIKDVADLLGIKESSARVACSRYAKKGIILRLKRDFYILKSRWDNLRVEEYFKLANFLQVPSYISFSTALSFYQVTTQVQRNFFESASLKRSCRFEVEDVSFNFYKLRKKYYFGFRKIDGVFIASKEKALVDSFYLYSFGKYKIDFASLSLNKLNKSEVKKILDVYPQKTQKTAAKLCKI